MDSVNVVDSVRLIDSLLVVDSLNIIDSVNVIDSVRVADSLNVIDSINVVDSIRVVDSVNVVDSLNIVDSLNVVDSVVVRDSVAVHGPEYYLGECNAEKADSILSANIGNEEKYFICDRLTFLWRTATALDWNNQYVRESAVSKFVPLKDVIDSLAEGEKLVAVIRHAERGDDYSTAGPLNDNGVSQARSLGEKLKGDLEFYYAGSPSTRTHQTCNNIAKARGEVDTLADTIEFLGGTWFVKDSVVYKKYKDEHSGSWNVTSQWLYEGTYADAFYNLPERSTEYLEEIIIPAFERSGKRVGILVGHDLQIIPLVSYFSQNSIDLKYYSNKRWLNYLAGVAIVLKPDGTRRFYAVKGLDAGTMTN